MRNSCCAAVVVMAGLWMTARASEARVISLVVEQRRPFAGGIAWGSAGPYERLDGVVRIEVDPNDPLNAIIVNLDKAPRNARGRVEFTAPFYVLKPVDMARSNRKLFYGINNRGGQVEFTGRIAPGLPPSVYREPLAAEDVG